MALSDDQLNLLNNPAALGQLQAAAGSGFKPSRYTRAADEEIIYQAQEEHTANMLKEAEEAHQKLNESDLIEASQEVRRQMGVLKTQALARHMVTNPDQYEEGEFEEVLSSLSLGFSRDVKAADWLNVDQTSARDRLAKWLETIDKMREIAKEGGNAAEYLAAQYDDGRIKEWRELDAADMDARFKYADSKAKSHDSKQYTEMAKEAVDKYLFNTNEATIEEQKAWKQYLRDNGRGADADLYDLMFQDARNRSAKQLLRDFEADAVLTTTASSTIYDPYTGGVFFTPSQNTRAAKATSDKYDAMRDKRMKGPIDDRIPSFVGEKDNPYKGAIKGAETRTVEQYVALERERDEWVRKTRVIKAYDELIKEVEQVNRAKAILPFLSKQEAVMAVAALNDEDMSKYKGYFAQRTDRTNFLWSVCQSLRPKAEHGAWEDFFMRVVEGVKGGVYRGYQWGRGAVDTLQKYDAVITTAIFQGSDAAAEVKKAWDKQSEALAKDIAFNRQYRNTMEAWKPNEDDHWYEQAVKGIADSGFLQGTAIVAGAARAGSMWASRAKTPHAQAIAGFLKGIEYGAEALGAASMIGDQYENLLLNGVDADRAAVLALVGGCVDWYVERMNIDSYLHLGLSANQLRQTGIRALFSTAVKFEPKMFAKSLGTNFRNLAQIALSEAGEELLQGWNQAGMLALGKGDSFDAKGVLQAYLNQDSVQEAMHQFIDAIPTCIGFGFMGTASPFRTGLKASTLQFGESADRVAKEYAMRTDLNANLATDFAAAKRFVMDNAARHARATAGMNPNERSTYFAKLADSSAMSPNEAAFYEEASAYYRTLIKMDGQEMADAVVKGEINEALLSRSGIALKHDSSGNINGVAIDGVEYDVVTETGAHIVVDSHTGEMGPARGGFEEGMENAEGTQVALRNKQTGETVKLPSKIRLTVAAKAKELGAKMDEKGNLIDRSVVANTATIPHELSHAFLFQLANSDILSAEQKELLKPLLDGALNETFARFIEALVVNAEKDFKPSREAVSVRNILKNLATAIKRVFGSTEAFLPAVVSEGGSGGFDMKAFRDPKYLASMGEQIKGDATLAEAYGLLKPYLDMLAGNTDSAKVKEDLEKASAELKAKAEAKRAELEARRAVALAAYKAAEQAYRTASGDEREKAKKAFQAARKELRKINSALNVGNHVRKATRYSIAHDEYMANNAEYKAVYDRYHDKDGNPLTSYLKAPNGKPTNLTEEQWNLVRTPSFKKWFGDWEYGTAKLLAIDAINPTTIKLLADGVDVEEVYKTLKSATNKDGRKVRFVNSILGKILRHKGYDTKNIVPYLKDIFANAEYLGSQADKGARPRGDGTIHKEHRNFVGYHNYLGKFTDGNGIYFVRFTVQELKTRKKDFIPNEFHSTYISDVEVYKNTDLPALNAENSSGKVGVVGFDDIVANYLNEFKGNADEVSKVIDENGEPLVVYHGTDGNFNEFKESMIGLTDHGWYGRGFYFASPSAEATEDNIAFAKSEAEGYGKRVISAFLNIKNPLVTNRADSWTMTDAAARKFSEDAKANGHDGILVDDAEGSEIVAFSPAQIKSATDNTGAFSSTNPDIRFSLVLGEKGARKLEENGQIIDNLAVAKEMLGDRWWKDLSTDEKVKIKLATGWERGADGLWRYEVPDLKYPFGQANDYHSIQEDIAIRYNETNEDLVKLNRYWAQAKAKAVEKYGDDPWMSMDKIREFLSFAYQGVKERREKTFEEIKKLQRKLKKARYPKTKLTLRDFAAGTVIEKAYPELMDTKITIKSMRGNYLGMVRNGEIFIESDQIPYDAFRTVTHEVQHLIQKAEGFARGGNERIDGREGYHRLAGEVEARNAEKRIGKMTAGGVAKWLERLAESGGDPSTVDTWLLEQTEDVARDSQIVLHDFIFSARDYLKAVDAVKRGVRFSLAPIEGGADYVERFGKTLAADEIRRTLPNYNPIDYKTHIDKTGYVGRVFQKTFDYLLEETKGKGSGEVVFLAGGNGAGKSTAAKMTTDADFVVDSTLGNLEAVRSQMQAVIDNGQTPHLVFVYRDWRDALGGIAKRVSEGGHIVSPLSFANSHTKSIENALLLSEEFGDKIDIDIIRNTPEGPVAITIDELKGLAGADYGEIRTEANRVLDEVKASAGSGEDRVAGNAGTDRGGAGGEAKQLTPSGVQKSAYVAYPDASAEIGSTRFSIADDAKALILKKRDDIKGKVLDDTVAEIMKFPTIKAQKAALHWFVRGAIRLPEDAPKVIEALAYADRAKGKGKNTDALSYPSPMAMIEALHEFKPKAKRIDPDTVPELSDKREFPMGVTTYLVQDDRAGQEAMRRIINTHWGEDANPWCLLHGDGKGKLSDGRDGGYDAAYYWKHYNGLPKRVAFKDGKLLAFMATDVDVDPYEFKDDFRDVVEMDYPEIVEEYDADEDKYTDFPDWMRANHKEIYREVMRDNFTPPEQWWDRQDSDHTGIPLGNIPVPNDPFGRWAYFEIRDGESKRIGGFLKGEYGKDGYVGWNTNGYKMVEVVKVGHEFYGWYEDGSLARAKKDGAEYYIYRDGDVSSVLVNGEDVTDDYRDKAMEIYRQYDQRIPHGKGVDAVESDGTVRFSLATYDSDGRETLSNWLDQSVANGSLTRKDADDILKSTDAVRDVMKKWAKSKKYVSFGKWSEAKVELDENGKPYFGVIRTNGDYAYNIDFSTVCKKRRPLDAIFNALVSRGIVNAENIGTLLSRTNIPKMQEIIKRHGLEVACALCFVDAKRYNLGNDTEAFAKLWNGLVDEKLNQPKKWKKRLADAKGESTYVARCVRKLEEDSSARVTVDPSELLSGEKFDEFVKAKPEVATMYRSFKGQSKAKESTLDVPYNNDILKMFKHSLNPDVPSTITPEQAFAVGGVRLQSFSDFVARLTFDYVQMFADLAARKLPLHSYTKEPDFIKLFGKTGAKLNMSLVPNGTGVLWLTKKEMKAQKRIAIIGKDKKPVVENGMIACFDFADECFPPEEAFSLRSDDGNVGTIMVGVSDEHIDLMLSDPRIDMVIPYHKSSINPEVAKARGIDKFSDYTSVQHTKGAKKGKDFDFYGDLAKTNDPRKTAANYVAWCKANKYTPKFSKWATNANYYKLLADFRLFKDDGTYAPQTAVQQVVPDAEWQKAAMEALLHDNANAVKLDQETAPIVEEISRDVFGVSPQSNKRFSIAPLDADYEGHVPYLIAHSIFANNGKTPSDEVVKDMMRRAHIVGVDPDTMKADAMEIAKQMADMLAKAGSDPKVQATIKAANLALRQRNAQIRAKATIQRFDELAAKHSENVEKAYRRRVDAVTGMAYNQMLAYYGLDMDDILKSMPPIPRMAAAESKDGEGGEATDEAPAELTDAEKKVVDDIVKTIVDRGAKLAEEANSDGKAREREEARLTKEAKPTEDGADEAEDEGAGVSEDEKKGLAFDAAIREGIRNAGISVANPFAMVALIRNLTEDYIKRNPELVPDLDEKNVFSSRIALAMFASNLSSFANSVAAGYSPSYARIRIAEACAKLDAKGLTTLRQVEMVGESIFENLNRDIIRQSRAELIKKLLKGDKKSGWVGIDALAKKHGVNMDENDRVISAFGGQYLKILRRAVKMTDNAVEERSRQLEEIIDSFDDLADKERFRDYENAKLELDVLTAYGALKNKMPAQIIEASDLIKKFVTEDLDALEKRKAQFEEMRERLAVKMEEGIVGDPKLNGRDEDREVGFMYSLMGMLEVRASILTSRCKDENIRNEALAAFKQIEEVMFRSATMERNFVIKARNDMRSMIKEIFGSNGESKFSKLLDTEVDEEIAAKLDRGDQHTKWRIGNVMQMYVSVVQSDYANNCEAYGRTEGYALQLLDVIEKTDPRLITIIDRMRGMYAEYGQTLSEVTMRVSGVPMLTPNELYMPVAIKRPMKGKNGESRQFSAYAPALTPRVKHGLDFDQTADIMSVWADRIAQSGHTVGYLESAPIIQGTMQSTRLLEKIRKAWGNKAASQWNDYVFTVLSGSKVKSTAADGIATQISKVTSRLFMWGNITSNLNQLAAIFTSALSRDMGISGMLKNVGMWALKPVQMWKACADLTSTRAFVARYGSELNQAVVASQREGKYGALRGGLDKVVNFGMAGLSLMDKVGVMALANVYYSERTALENGGMKPEEASERAAEKLMLLADKTAQGTTAMNASDLQTNGNAITKMFLQFKTAPLQQFQYEYAAWVDWKNDKGNMKKARRLLSAIVVNHVLANIVPIALSALMVCLVGKPDDEKEWEKEIAKALASTFTGAYGAIPLAGMMIDSVGSVVGDIMTGNKPNASLSIGTLPSDTAFKMIATVMKDFASAGGEFIEACDNPTAEDILDGVKEMALALSEVTWAGRKFKRYRKSNAESKPKIMWR